MQLYPEQFIWSQENIQISFISSNIHLKFCLLSYFTFRNKEIGAQV